MADKFKVLMDLLPQKSRHKEYIQQFEHENMLLLAGKGHEIDWGIENFLDRCCVNFTDLLRANRDEDRVNVLEDYKYNFFTEVIQNANDVEGSQQQIDIITRYEQTEKGEKVFFTVTYSDEGFTLENIYGFLHERRSSKNTPHQSGKFGVGIKSLFLFVEDFLLESNIKVSFDITNSPIITLNNDWEKGKTKLSFSYIQDSSGKDSFYTQKLTDLSKQLATVQVLNTSFFVESVGSKPEEVATKVVFDLNNLLFMDLMKGEIQTIRFSSEQNNTVRYVLQGKKGYLKDVNQFVACETVNQLIWAKQLQIVKEYISEDFEIIREVLFQQIYVIVSSTDKEYKNNILFAIPVEKNNKLMNSCYSIYRLILSSVNEIKNLGLRIHVPFTNDVRTDFAKDSIDLEKRRNEIQIAFRKMLLQLAQYEGDLKKTVSIILYNILEEYLDVDLIYYIDGDEIINTKHPFYSLLEQGVTLNGLLKCNNPNIKLIVPHETKSYKIPKEIIESYNDLHTIQTFYEEQILKEDTISLNDPQLFSICQSIIKKAQLKDIDWVLRLLNYVHTPKTLVNYRISISIADSSTDEINIWLEQFSKDLQIVAKKLLARLEITTLYTKFGLLNSKENGLLNYIFNVSQESVKDFEDRYKKDLTQYQRLKKRFREYLVLDRHKTLQDFYGEKYGYIKKSFKEKLQLMPNNYEKLQKWNNPKYILFVLSQHASSIYADVEKYQLSWERNFPELPEISMDEKRVIARLFFHHVSIEEKLHDYVSMILEAPCLIESKITLEKIKSPSQAIQWVEFRNIQMINLSFLKNLEYNDFYQMSTDFLGIDCLNNRIKNSLHIKYRAESTSLGELKSSVMPWILNRLEKSMMLPQLELGYINIGNSSANKNDLQAIVEKLFNGQRISMHEITHPGQGNFVMYLKDKVCYYRTPSNKFEHSDYVKVDNPEIIIFYSGCDEKRALDYVLEHLISDKEHRAIIDSFISRNIVTEPLETQKYEAILEIKNKNRNIQSQTFYYADATFMYKQEWRLAEKVKLLVARGSYNMHCPICFERQNKENDFKYAVLLATGEDNHQYQVETVFCDTCWSAVNKGLSKAQYKKGILYLTLEIIASDREYTPLQFKIELSPINKIMLQKM